MTLFSSARVAPSHKLVFSGVGLALFSLCVPIFGLLPFRFGWFSQMESIIAAVWFSGGLAGLWNYYLYRAKPDLARTLYRMPLVWGWGVLALLSIVPALFHPAPLQSLTGNPQTADGIATLLALMLLAPLYIFIVRLRLIGVARQLLLWVPTVVVTVSSILTIIGGLGTPFLSLLYWPWAPLWFPDYLHFYIFSLGAFYVAWRRSSTPIILDIFYGLLLLTLLYFSKNKTLLLSGVLVFVTLVALRFPLLKRFDYAKRNALYVGGGLLTLTIILCFLNYWPDIPKVLLSLKSRAHLLQFTFLSYVQFEWGWHEWVTFLFGHGWGDFNNAAVSNLTLPHDFGLYQEGMDRTEVEFADRDQVNSHNIFIEYFLALGVVGLGLFCTIQYQILKHLRSPYQGVGTIFLVLIGTLWMFWFQTPHSYTYTTLAFCALFSRTPMAGCYTVFVKPLRLMILPTSFVLLGLSTLHLSSAIVYSRSIAIAPGDDLFKKVDETLQTPWLLYDRFTGAHRTKQILSYLAGDLLAYSANEKGADIEQASKRVVAITHFLTHNIPQESSALSLSIAMNILSKLATQEKTSRLFVPGSVYEKAWLEMGEVLYHSLPYRSDLLVPLWSYLLTTHQGRLLRGAANAYLEIRADDPISLWFLGTLDLQEDMTFEKGLCRMKEALDQRVDRYVPIAPQQVERIRAEASKVQCYAF